MCVLNVSRPVCDENNNTVNNSVSSAGVVGFKLSLGLSLCPQRVSHSNCLNADLSEHTEDSFILNADFLSRSGSGMTAA